MQWIKHCKLSDSYASLLSPPHTFCYNRAGEIAHRKARAHAHTIAIRSFSRIHYIRQSDGNASAGKANFSAIFRWNVGFSSTKVGENAMLRKGNDSETPNKDDPVYTAESFPRFLYRWKKKSDRFFSDDFPIFDAGFCVSRDTLKNHCG